MTRLRVLSYTISADGYGAGPNQSLDQPMGTGTEELHRWLIGTRTFARLHGGGAGGTTGVDDSWAARGFEGIGAWIMGRNMFGPVRGPWPDLSWTGWWGDEPPYHCDVFVLTHHERVPLAMAGGTTFHFVTGGIEEAWRRAADAAGGLDVRLGGGAATIREYLAAGLVDDLHIAVSPLLLGSGEPLFAGLDLPALGYAVTASDAGEAATHLTITRSA